MFPVVGYVLPSVPSPCDRLSRLWVLWTDLTPRVSSAFLLVVSARLTCFPVGDSTHVPARNTWGLPSPWCFSTHIPRSSWTPADPRSTHPSDVHGRTSGIRSRSLCWLPSR